MLTRCATRRIPHSLYLDFLAPALLHRNQSTSSPPALRSLQRSKNAAQSPNPSILASQISQTLSLLNHHEGVIPPNTEIDLFNKTISSIKRGLFKKDISVVWQSWSLLADKNLLQYLGPPQIESYSKFIATSYDIRPSDKKWNASEKEAMEEIALFTAAAGHLEALNAILLSHIKAGKPNAVLDLYRKYVTKPSDHRTDEEVDGLESSDGHEDQSALESPVRNNSSKTEILLSAITACAMLDSFHEATHIILNANIRLNDSTVKRLLPTLPNSEKVADFVRRLGIVRMLGYPPIFLRHIANLAKDVNDQELEKLYNEIIDGVLGQEPWLTAVAHKSDSPTNLVPIPEFTWTSMITAFMKCKRPDLAEKLWDDMVKCGVKPQVAAWTAIFDGYNILGAYQESFGTWDAMISQGIKPDPLTYRAIIATLFKCRRPKDAMKKFREYEEDWSSRIKTSRSGLSDMDSQVLALHNTVLHGLFTNTDSEHTALEVFKKMQTQGPLPDIVSWNTLMGYYSRRGNLKMLASALQGLRQAGLSGDVFTYSITLSALLKAGREDAPELIIGIMKKHGIERNATVNTAIIDQILQTPDPQKLKAAISILTRMECEESIKAQPNEVTYTTILAGLYRGDWLSKDEMEAYRRDILRRMHDRGVRANRTTYHILFKACFESPTREGYTYALSHYNDMLRQRIVPNFDTWYILLEGLHKKGQVQIANDMADEMIGKWYEPSGSLRKLVHQIRNSSSNMKNRC